MRTHAVPRLSTYSDERVKKSFDLATTVVVAKVQVVTHSPLARYPERIGITEDAWLQIQESFKGPFQVGETVHIQAKVIRGPCGFTVRNDPPWIFKFNPNDAEQYEPAEISDTWLIYGYGDEPYDLDNSSPMSLRGSHEADVIRQMLRDKQDNASADVSHPPAGTSHGIAL